MDLASAASFAGGATGILFFRRHYAYMEPRLILITDWHVRPNCRAQPREDATFKLTPVNHEAFPISL